MRELSSTIGNLLHSYAPWVGAPRVTHHHSLARTDSGVPDFFSEQHSRSLGCQPKSRKRLSAWHSSKWHNWKRKWKTFFLNRILFENIAEEFEVAQLDNIFSKKPTTPYSIEEPIIEKRWETRNESAAISLMFGCSLSSLTHRRVLIFITRVGTDFEH